jgi:hypothetical protein
MAVISALSTLAFVTSQKIETSFGVRARARAPEASRLLDYQQPIKLGHQILNVGYMVDQSPREPAGHEWVEAKNIEGHFTPKTTPDTYKVKSGDSLWTIAEHARVNIYELASDNRIQLNVTLLIGKVLTLPSIRTNDPFAMAPSKDFPAGSYDAGELAYSANEIPDGSFGQCVVRRESRGRPQIWNGDHWGLFQFSPSTWAEYGGKPADFGSAGQTKQDKVFANAIAQDGQYNWIPYDHCSLKN